MRFRFAKHFNWLGWLCGVLLISLVPWSGLAQSEWKAPPDADGYTNPIKADAKSAAAGKEVYAKYCVLCHGEQGLGNGPSAAALNPKPANFADKARMKQSDGSMAWKILTGRNGMPSWEPVLSEDEIWNVINYVRTFAK